MLTISFKDTDHFVVRGTDRIVGDVPEPDFEMAGTAPLTFRRQQP